MVRIEWLGHSCFLIEGEGHRIIIDPFQRRGVGYPEINVTADLVLVTHDHADHNNVKAVRGNPKVIREPGHWESPIPIEAVQSFHDKSRGAERGTNVVYGMELDGVRIAHLGDLGEIPGRGLLDRFERTNVLLLPVGGIYTIDGQEATKVLELFSPNVAIPMHYKNRMVEWALDSAEKFLAGKQRVRKFDKNWVDVRKVDLPEPTEIWVLSPPGQ